MFTRKRTNTVPVADKMRECAGYGTLVERTIFAIVRFPNRGATGKASQRARLMRVKPARRL